MKIIIDPGHGGEDPGGGTNEYWKEKDMVLKISLYQYKRLKELGIDVELTRDEDMMLGRKERTEKVKKSQAAICISNHINAYNGKAEGAEVIHSIYSDGTFANLIMNCLVKEGAKKRRVFSKSHPKDSNKDYYYMHRLTGKVKTVIIEYGFADNDNDTKKILNNWKNYAEAVVKVICNYIGHTYTQPETIVENDFSDVSDWALESWKKAIEKGINDGKGAKKNITEEQLMVFFDWLGLLD